MASDTVQTSKALIFYALALFAYSGVKILVPTFYALDDTRVPVRTSMIAVGVKILVNFALIIPMGFLGLPLATAVASWLNLALLCRNLDRKIEGKWSRREFLPYLKIALASIMMGGLSWGALRLSLILLPGSGLLPSALRLGIAITVGLAAILTALQAMGVEETRQVVASVARRIGFTRGER